MTNEQLGKTIMTSGPAVFSRVKLRTLPHVSQESRCNSAYHLESSSSCPITATTLSLQHAQPLFQASHEYVIFTCKTFLPLVTATNSTTGTTTQHHHHHKTQEWSSAQPPPMQAPQTPTSPHQTTPAASSPTTAPTPNPPPSTSNSAKRQLQQPQPLNQLRQLPSPLAKLPPHQSSSGAVLHREASGRAVS